MSTTDDNERQMFVEVYGEDEVKTAEQRTEARAFFTDLFTPAVTDDSSEQQ